MHEQTNGLWCASLAQVSSTAHQLSFKCETPMPKKKPQPYASSQQYEK